MPYLILAVRPPVLVVLMEVLATRGVIAVEQMEPFADISLKMAS